MSELTDAEKVSNKRVLMVSWVSLFFDAWIIMLALGGIAHRQHLAQLSLSYFTCLLINIVATAFIPQGYRAAEYLRQIMLLGERND